MARFSLHDLRLLDRRRRRSGKHRGGRDRLERQTAEYRDDDQRHGLQRYPEWGLAPCGAERHHRHGRSDRHRHRQRHRRYGHADVSSDRGGRQHGGATVPRRHRPDRDDRGHAGHLHHSGGQRRWTHAHLLRQRQPGKFKTGALGQQFHGRGDADALGRRVGRLQHQARRGECQHGQHRPGHAVGARLHQPRRAHRHRSLARLRYRREQLRQPYESQQHGGKDAPVRSQRRYVGRDGRAVRRRGVDRQRDGLRHNRRHYYQRYGNACQRRSRNYGKADLGRPAGQRRQLEHHGGPGERGIGGPFDRDRNRRPGIQLHAGHDRPGGC